MYSAGYTPEQKEIIGMALRKVGFASWRRRESQGPWNEHWHGIAMDTEGLPPVAARQVTSYLNGRTGLVGNREDPDPRPKEIKTWEEYQQDKGLEPAEADTVPTGTSRRRRPTRTGWTRALLLDRDSDSDGLTDAFETAGRHEPAQRGHRLRRPVGRVRGGAVAHRPAVRRHRPGRVERHGGAGLGQ